MSVFEFGVVTGSCRQKLEEAPLLPGSHSLFCCLRFVPSHWTALWNVNQLMTGFRSAQASACPKIHLSLLTTTLPTQWFVFAVSPQLSESGKISAVARAKRWQAARTQALQMAGVILKPIRDSISLQVISAATSQHLLLLSITVAAGGKDVTQNT